MKKNKLGKNLLKLNRESIRNLGDQQLGVVPGGSTVWGTCAHCSSDARFLLPSPLPMPVYPIGPVIKFSIPR